MPTADPYCHVHGFTLCKCAPYIQGLVPLSTPVEYREPSATLDLTPPYEIYAGDLCVRIEGPFTLADQGTIVPLPRPPRRMVSKFRTRLAAR